MVKNEIDEITPFQRFNILMFRFLLLNPNVVNINLKPSKLFVNSSSLVNLQKNYLTYDTGFTKNSQLNSILVERINFIFWEKKD